MQAWRDTGQDRGEASGWPRGGGPSTGEAGRAAFPRWSQRVAPAAPQEAGGGHRSPRDGCVRIYKEPRGAGAASTSCPQQPGWGLLLQRSRGGAGWDWQDGASISPPRPPPGALPLALPVPGLQAPSPASQPASQLDWETEPLPLPAPIQHIRAAGPWPGGEVGVTQRARVPSATPSSPHLQHEGEPAGS